MTECQLYLISPLDVGGSFPDRLDRALAAGEGLATAFQFRVKDVDQHEAARLAAPLQEICAARDVGFVVNDSIALAKRLKADACISARAMGISGKPVKNLAAMRRSA